MKKLRIACFSLTLISWLSVVIPIIANIDNFGNLLCVHSMVWYVAAVFCTFKLAKKLNRSAFVWVFFSFILPYLPCLIITFLDEKEYKKDDVQLEVPVPIGEHDDPRLEDFITEAYQKLERFPKKDRKWILDQFRSDTQAWCNMKEPSKAETLVEVIHHLRDWANDMINRSLFQNFQTSMFSPEDGEGSGRLYLEAIMGRAPGNLYGRAITFIAYQSDECWFFWH
jgi:hypothetical protein